MIKTRLAALAACAAMLTASVSATDTSPAQGATSAARGAGITGTWKGAVYGDDGGPAGYPAKVRITKRNGTYHGKVNYPGLCSGTWKFRRRSHGWFTFREVITRGSSRCVTPVSAKARRVGAALKVVWREPRSGDTGHMRAHRV